MRRLGIWVGIAAGTVAGGLLLDTTGLPSSYLFAALVVGLAIALARPRELDVPRTCSAARRPSRASRSAPTWRATRCARSRDSWLPVALVSLATLGLSLLVRRGARAHHARSTRRPRRSG